MKGKGSGIPQKMLSWENITEKARKNKSKVAIGIESRVIDTIRLAENASSLGLADVVVVTKNEQKTSLEQVVCDDPPATLVELLKKGDIKGAVRGTLPSNECMKSIKIGYNIERIHRAVLLQTSSTENSFLLAPVGVDEGLTPGDLIESGKLAAGLLSRIGITPRVGVLSIGRGEDRERHPLIGTSLDESTMICKSLEVDGISCENSEIRIEKAVNTCNVILAPNGVMGNLIFRSLCLMGNGICYGAPVLNIPAVFVDTSRDSYAYERALAFASMLT